MRVENGTSPSLVLFLFPARWRWRIDVEHETYHASMTFYELKPPVQDYTAASRSTIQDDHPSSTVVMHSKRCERHISRLCKWPLFYKAPNMLTYEIFGPGC
ncbi:hypothetical protein AcV5_004802 [Taiwanofungus camphoratus]|nr:hypothetical protein AcV5_004802 [Antrodia cinnamomea]